MKAHALLVSIVIAALLGVAQHYFLVWGWGYIAQYSPLLGWLIGIGLRGVALRATLFPMDFVTSVIISLPAAYVLRILRPRVVWLYVTVAVVPAFAWFDLGLVGKAFEPVFLLGWTSELLALPAAAWLLRFASRRPREPLSPERAGGAA